MRDGLKESKLKLVHSSSRVWKKSLRPGPNLVVLQIPTGPIPSTNQVKNQRIAKRINPPEFYVTEHCGDYIYISQALNLSSTGVFLLNRFSNKPNERVQLLFHFPGNSLESRFWVDAEVVRTVYQRRDNQKSLGTAYRFLSPLLADLEQNTAR